MFLDARTLSDGTEIESDVCIVGAGAAGIAIATVLARRGMRVALLESGGFDYDERTQDLYRGENVGYPYFDLDVCRLRYFGGTTNHWQGWCRPLDPIDFRPRAGVPNSGWPIDRTAIEPYFAAAAEIVDLESASFEVGDHADLVPQFFLEKPFGERVVTKIWLPSPPTRFGEKFRTEIDQSRQIVCCLNANVQEFEYDPEGRQVSGVRAFAFGDKRFRVSASRFVLATGGIENPRLLLASRGRAPDGIGNEHGNVGRYFMAHPQVFAGQILLSERGASALPPHDPYGISRLCGVSLDEELEAELGLPNNWITFYRSSPNRGTDRPEGYRALTRILGGRSNGTSLTDELSIFFGDLDGAAQGLYREMVGGSRETETNLFELFAKVELIPNRDSRIALSDERDEFGMPRVRVDWRMLPEDKANLRRTIEALALETGRSGLGHVRLADWLIQSDDYWSNSMDPDYHHFGTTRMSESPRDGVVDANCRVHGVANLYVAGSSVFPTTGFCSPTFTIVCLALRLADHLLDPEVLVPDVHTVSSSSADTAED